MKKIILTALMFAFTVLPTFAGDINYKIHKLIYDESKSITNLNNIHFEYNGTGISSSITNNNTLFNHMNYGLKYTFYNHKNKKLDKITIWNGFLFKDDNNLESYNQLLYFEDIPQNTKSYKIEPVKESLISFDLNESLKSIVNHVVMSIQSALFMSMAEDINNEYYINFNDIVEKAIISRLPIKEKIGRYSYKLDNDVILYFKYNKHQCDFAPEHSLITDFSNVCGFLTIDINGSNLPNSNVNSNVINDRFNYVVFADKILPDYSTYNFLNKQDNNTYISDELKKDIYSNYFNFLKKIKIDKVEPYIQILIGNTYNKDVDFTINVVFYNQAKEQLKIISKQDVIDKDVTGSAGLLYDIKIDFNDIPEDAMYYSLELSKVKVKE